MKIAFLADSMYPFTLGGMQKHSWLLVKYLAKTDIPVDVYYLTEDLSNHTQLFESFPENIQELINCIPVEIKYKNFLPGSYISDSYKNSITLFESIKPHLNKYDFIYSKSFAAWKLIEEKKKNTHISPPICINFHGYNTFQPKSNLKEKLQQYLFKGPIEYHLKNADFVFSIGNSISDILINQNVPKSKILEIPNGVENHWIRGQNELSVNTPLRFCFLGRFEPLKGAKEMYNVLKNLNKHSFSFSLIGDLNYKLPRHLNNFHHIGEITEEQKLIEELDKNDVLVFPSHTEGIPYAILECMARGLVIISTNVGGIPELVDENNGILIEPNNSDQLYNAMDKVLYMSEKKIMEMKKNSIQKVKENYIWDDIANKFVEKIKGISNDSS